MARSGRAICREEKMKRKAIAILNVVSWGLFWAFGLIAATSPNMGEGMLLLAVLLSGLGFLSGIISYLALSRSMHPAEVVPKRG